MLQKKIQTLLLMKLLKDKIEIQQEFSLSVLLDLFGC